MIFSNRDHIRLRTWRHNPRRLEIVDPEGTTQGPRTKNPRGKRRKPEVPGSRLLTLWSTVLHARRRLSPPPYPRPYNGPVGCYDGILAVEQGMSMEEYGHWASHKGVREDHGQLQSRQNRRHHSQGQSGGVRETLARGGSRLPWWVRRRGKHDLHTHICRVLTHAILRLMKGAEGAVEGDPRPWCRVWRAPGIQGPWRS